MYVYIYSIINVLVTNQHGSYTGDIDDIDWINATD